MSDNVLRPKLIVMFIDVISSWRDVCGMRPSQHAVTNRRINDGNAEHDRRTRCRPVVSWYSVE